MQYKAPGNFKPFDEGIVVKLLEVLNTSSGHMFHQIKDKQMLYSPQKIVKDMGKLN